MNKLLLSALVIAIFIGKAAAFWQYGHLFVARVAYDKLSFSQPGKAALDKATQLLQVYSASNPSMTNLEGNYPFVECATFADEIKAKGGTWQSGWHFVDQPYLDQGGSINDYPGFKFDTDSIDKAIPDIINWLSGNSASNYQSSFVYTTMQTQLPSLSEEERKSYALRLLIHYVGDIHQPLHATARVDPQYPKGDAGGNFVAIPVKEGAKNLHSVWDSVLYAYTATPNMPFNYGDWNTLGTEATGMESKYSFSSSEWQSMDVNLWAQESFELAKSNVYPGVKAGQALSASYVSSNQDAI